MCRAAPRREVPRPSRAVLCRVCALPCRAVPLPCRAVPCPVLLRRPPSLGSRATLGQLSRSLLLVPSLSVPMGARTAIVVADVPGAAAAVMWWRLARCQTAIRRPLACGKGPRRRFSRFPRPSAHPPVASSSVRSCPRVRHRGGCLITALPTNVCSSGWRECQNMAAAM